MATTDRIQRLKHALEVSEYPICVEKAVLVMDSLRKTIGEPEIVRRAKATASYLDGKTIFIEDGELIIGNVASKPMGLEAGSMGPTWSAEELQVLRSDGYVLSQDDEAALRSMDDYWRGRSLWERMGQYYDDERLWPFIQSGILLPGWKSKTDGRGQGSAGVGWGLGNGQSLIVVDFEQVLRRGLLDLVAEAKHRLGEVRYTSAEAMKRADFYQSVILVGEALMRLAERFADLAEQLALVRERRDQKARTRRDRCDQPECARSTCEDVPRGHAVLLVYVDHDRVGHGCGRALRPVHVSLLRRRRGSGRHRPR